MSKKEWVLIGLVLALGGLYAVYFGDWFRPKFIRIEHTARRLRSGFGGPGRSDASQPSMSITFSLGRSYRLTSLRVVLAAEFQTNKFAHSVWRLVSEKGSAPVDRFAYGFPIQGMTPALAGAEPEPLEPGAQYRLLVETAKLKGEHDFNFSEPNLEQ